MARIEYQFPIRAIRGQMEKGGIIFKRMGKTKFTQSFVERVYSPSPAQKIAAQQFAQIAKKVAEYKQSATKITELYNAFHSQTDIRSFKKFLWQTAKTELGI